MATAEIQSVIICERNRFLADSLCQAFGTYGAFKSQAHAGHDLSLLDLVARTDACAVLVNPEGLAGLPEHLVRSLARARKGCRAVAYFASEAKLLASGCLRAGFGGAVSQAQPVDDLAEALRAVCLGGIYVDASLVISGGGEARETCPPAAPDILSAREQIVLEHVARGHSHKEIARLLQLSTKTVETYKLRGTRKLGLSRKSLIVDYALQNDWLS